MPNANATAAPVQAADVDALLAARADAYATWTRLAWEASRVRRRPSSGTIEIRIAEEAAEAARLEFQTANAAWRAATRAA